MKDSPANSKEKMNEEFIKTNMPDLTKLSQDMMHVHTQHEIGKTCKLYHVSATYNKCIEQIEKCISQKLEITLLEVKLMLNYKKKIKDAKEKKLFQKKTKTILMEKKRKKYFEKLTKDMEEIQNAVFNTHHAVVKLSPIAISDGEPLHEQT